MPPEIWDELGARAFGVVAAWLRRDQVAFEQLRRRR
jgi:hypothetical protein